MENSAQMMSAAFEEILVRVEEEHLEKYLV
jgi:hypothetical protein